VLAALALAIGAHAAYDHINRPDFRGKGRYDRSMRVAFKIVDRPGRDYVRFDANNVPWNCDDGTGDVDFNVLKAKFDTGGQRFERVHYSGSKGSEDMYWFRGTLREDGKRAQGFFFAWFDPYDPPDGPNLTECSTSGKRRWVAKRVG
jgi:hypothetical protein